MNEIEDGTMNKNTAKAIKVVKAYMKRTGAKIISGAFGGADRGCFLTLYLAAHGYREDILDDLLNMFDGDKVRAFYSGFDRGNMSNDIAKAGAQAREAFKKELDL